MIFRISFASLPTLYSMCSTNFSEFMGYENGVLDACERVLKRCFTIHRELSMGSKSIACVVVAGLEVWDTLKSEVAAMDVH